jgi:sugar O-acyltransferase (sialic acid O-acetyltransferase NeuD family)
MRDESVVLVGAGGHGKVVLATLRACGLEVALAVDDDRDKHGAEWLGLPVVAPEGRLDGCSAILAIGDNAQRARFSRRFERTTWIAAIHPRAFVDPSASIGPGTVVLAGAIVQAGARIGRHVIVNTGATVDHDCVLGDYVHVGPGVHLAGGVVVEEGALVGIGGVATPGVRIGAWSTVGAGAALVRDVEPRSTAVGVPARRVEPRDAG